MPSVTSTRLALAAPEHRDRDLVAGLLRVDRALERRRGRDVVPVERDDDVAARRHLLAVDRGRPRRRAEARVGGRRSGPHLGDGGAVRHVDHPDAEVGVLDLAGLDQLRDDRPHGVRRDREPDAVVAARLALDLRVHADHPALAVEERAARVAVVDRRVGLDRVVDREVVRSGHLAVEGADDAARDRALEAERAAHGDHGVADRDLARVAERERLEEDCGRVDPDHGEVGGRVGADELAPSASSRPRTAPRSSSRPRRRAGS